eukprot:TRINITY_DN1111_c1_g1_i2.p1 TRINITY_DN1111_c1_g1~~TRINITY_DN1111_c1_g1_i2.p1  ORF type:complete len:890 (+),score=223.12 TRINITY_DN1111_c1_g1_i2:679-3348(+)
MSPVNSNGLIVRDSPLHHSLTLLLIQLLIIIAFSRILAVVLRPLRQPRVIAELIGGILLGPSVLGRIPGFLEHVFPEASLPILETVATLALLFFLFLIGLELDVNALKTVGPKALVISASGIILPFALAVPVTVCIKGLGLSHVGFGYLYLFTGVAIGITAFPVLARILAETRLLTTDIGQIAMAAAAAGDVVAWCLLALTVAVLNSRNQSPIAGLWILLAGIGFILFMFIFIRPIFRFIAQRNDERGVVSEFSVCLALSLVLVASLLTDIIGIHPIFGAFIAGMMIPHDSAYAVALTSKVEDFIAVTLLPAYFAVSGLKTQIASINSGKAVVAMLVIIFAACFGKIVACTAAACAFKMPFRKSLTIGLLMNSKGLVELIVLNVGLQAGVLDQQLFATFVIMCLVTTFMATPLVMWVYPPARFQKQTLSPAQKLQAVALEHKPLRLLACLYGRNDIPGAVKITELAKGREQQGLRVHALHLQELSERPSAILTMQRWAGKVSPAFGMTNVGLTFKSFGDIDTKVPVTSSVAVSPLTNMHEEITSAAARSQSNVILLPYQPAGAIGRLLDFPGGGLDQITSQTLKAAPCTVALLVNRTEAGPTSSPVIAPERFIENGVTKAVMLFFGGPDDREALSLAARIGGHPEVELTVIRFLPSEAWALALQQKAAAKQAEEKQELLERRASQGDSSGASPEQDTERTEGKKPVVDDECEPVPKVVELKELARRTNLGPDDRTASGSSEASAVSVVIDRLQPDKERALDDAALAFLYAEAKRDHSEGRRVRVKFENVELDQQSVWSAVKAIKLHQYNLIVFGRNLVCPPPILTPEDEGAALTRGNSFKMLRDSLSAAASGWANTDVRSMLGPVADNLFKSGVIEQASLLVVQDSESR